MANTATDIQKLYVAYFNRPADKLGLDYWMKSSMTVQQIANSFAVQDEYKNAYAGKTTSEIVNQIYKNLFNRSADVEGLSYWVAEISAGRSTLGYAAFQIMNGPKAGSADAIAVENKVAAATAFTTDIDTTDEVIAYESANVETLGVVKAWLAGVTDAATLATAKASLTANLKAVVDAKAVVNVVGKSFTLLNTADTVTGTDNNDTIVATDLTLSSADRIMGGAGADELKLSAQTTQNYAAFEMKSVETVTVTADGTSTQTIDLSGATDITNLKSLNSAGTVTLNQVTTLANLEVNNTTTGNNVTVSYQDAVVAGKTDTVKVALVNNSNAGIGTLTLGSTGAALGGVETIAITTSGAASTVATLASTAPTITVEGDKGLTVTNNLNDAVTTFDASKLTGASAVSIKFAATTAVTSVKTAAGADSVTMTGNTKNATVSLGAEADVLVAGLGDDVIDLGEGNDRIEVAVNGLTVNDSITGGAGADTLRLLAADTISKSEAEKVTAVETFDLRGAGGTVLTVTDNLLTTISTGSDRFTVTTASSTGANTVDITNLTFGNTNKLQVTGGLGNTAAVAQNETVIANDATVNAKAILSFGSGTTDTLRVIDGATMTADDLSGITGLEVIDLRAASAVSQTWNIFLTDALVRGATLANSNADDSVGGVAVASDAAVAAGSLVIDINNNIPAGSIVNINTDGLTATLGAGAITVKNNANVTVNVAGTGTTAGVHAQVTVQNSLRYTLNSDNMTGTANNDTFLADSLSQVQVADSITGAGGTGDILQLNFSLNNVGATVNTQLNGTAVATTEVLTFNTNNAIAFSDVGVTAGFFTGFTTANFGSGNDTVGANATAGTYNMGAGNNTFTTAATVVETVNTGAGTDAVNFGAVAQWASTDTLALGTGTDTVTVTAIAALDTSLFNTLTSVQTGIDKIVYNASGAVASLLTVDDGLVDGSDSTSVLNIDINDTGTSATSIFTAGGVVAGNSVNVLVVANAAVGIAAAAAGNAGVDFSGGAGNDTFTTTVTTSADGTSFRGNGGADTFVLKADAAGALDSQVIEFATINDGAQQGANTGFDSVTGFQTTIDVIRVALGESLETDLDDVTANDVIAFTTDGALNTTVGEALLWTHAASAITDAQLVESGFATVLARINTGLVSAAGTDAMIVIQGQTQTAIYWYAEDGVAANSASATELRLIAVVSGAQLAAADFAIA